MATEANLIPNSIYGDPLFVNPTTLDYHLQSESLAYGSGAYRTDSDAIDLDRVKFTNPPSMGCYDGIAFPRVKITVDEDGIATAAMEYDIDGYDIYYTINDSTPTVESAIKYTTPITLSGSTMIKAIAVLPNSNTKSRVYAIAYSEPQSDVSSTTQQIQGYLNSVTDTVVLSRGTFVTNSPITVTDGKTLLGQGMQNTTISRTGTTTYTDPGNCVILNNRATLFGVTVTGGNCPAKWGDGGAGVNI